METTGKPVTGISSRTFVRSVLGEKVVCTLSNGQTASGRLICVDRLKNLILSDCVCEQQICSADYVPSTTTDELSKQPPIHQITTRYLQQAMIPGNHVKAIYLCNRFAYETAYEGALVVESYSMT